MVINCIDFEFLKRVIGILMVNSIVLLYVDMYMNCLRFNFLYKFLKVDGVLMYGLWDCIEYDI